MQELEIARLQIALQALTASPNADSQAPAVSSTLPNSDTGVFSSRNTPPAHTAAACATSVQGVPTRHGAGGGQSASGRVTAHQGGHTQQQLFLYPEDTPLLPQQGTGNQHHAQARPHAHGTGVQQQQQQQQQQRLQQPQDPAIIDEAQEYTVEEPESPVQQVIPEHAPSGSPTHGRQPSEHTRGPQDRHRDPPAGCLYQGTTIRRTTTPSRSGRAWTQHEEITVRQIREIRQAEACNGDLPPPHCPHVMEGRLPAVH